MKKLFILLLIFFISTIGIYSVEMTFCCDDVAVTTSINENCCVNINVFNPYCALTQVVFFQYDPTISDYVQISFTNLTYGESTSIVLCPFEGQTNVQYRVRLVDSSTQHPECLSDNGWVEGFTQYSGTVDLADCCPCPANRDDWLSVIVQRDRTCPGFGCRATIAGFNIPEDITCYSSYILEYNQMMTSLQSLTNNTIVGTTFCLGNNTSSQFSLFLFKGNTIEWDSACVISKPVVCDSTVFDPEDTTYCKPDCPDSNWKADRWLPLTLPNGCQVKVHFTFRTACAPFFYQDLQIIGIMIIDNCVGMTDKQVYQETLKELVKQDPMGFDPKYNTVGCSDIWRVINASCWKTDLVFNPATGQFSYVQHKCDSSECCVQKYRVCRDSTNNVTMTPLGSPLIPTTINCISIAPPVVADPNDPYQFICHTSCDWLALEYYPYVPPEENQPSGFDNNSIQSIRTENNSNMKIEIYNLYGILLGSYSVPNSTNLNNVNPATFINSNGLYLYKTYKNGILINAGKFTK